MANVLQIKFFQEKNPISCSLDRNENCLKNEDYIKVLRRSLEVLKKGEAFKVLHKRILQESWRWSSRIHSVFDR